LKRKQWSDDDDDFFIFSSAAGARWALFFLFFSFSFVVETLSFSISAQFFFSFSSSSALSSIPPTNQQSLKELRLRDDARGADGKELVSVKRGGMD